jgi:hypothetical protein
MTVELDTTGLVVGDNAGLALLSTPYAGLAVVKSADGATLHRFQGFGGGRRGVAPASTNAPVIAAANPPNHVWLRIACNFDADEAAFSWSADGKQFTPVGNPFSMTFQLTTFQGVRPALFNYNTSGRSGGCADFDNFTCEEPRARGVEREIPIGKTITLASGADGSFLAADVQRNVLISMAGDFNGDIPPHLRFHVVDLGLGRVALKASNGRFVSVAGDGVVLRELAAKKPRDTETFQWVNLLRGDTMLMSLTNHRYLASRPNEPRPVTVTAAGPQPARKGGECFKWKIVR